eukprot:SAG22_NODE_2232_length_2810_cov_2.172999_2_plen_68_part_00
MADINYFLEIPPECVKFILNQLGYEEVGRAACVCREFYKELSPAQNRSRTRSGVLREDTEENGATRR